MVSAQGSTDMQEFFAFLALLMSIFPKTKQEKYFLLQWLINGANKCL